MSDWLAQLQALGRDGVPCVLITVAVVKGSAPRETGTKMLVSQDKVFGTIGGGHLELKAVEIARERLSAHPEESVRTLHRFPLGPSLGQCCGGVVILALETIPASQPAWIATLARLQQDNSAAVLVSAAEHKLIVTAADSWGNLGNEALQSEAVNAARHLLLQDAGTLLQTSKETLILEPIRPCDLHIVLFGAGHVGRALVSVLSGLPCRITWVDSREDQFPERIADNVIPTISDDPLFEVDQAVADSYFLIMTHSHALDLELCERILQRGDFRYCGLIGSQSKRNRFEKRLGLQGLTTQDLQRLRCPIGINGISSKHPTAIAIAVAAEILRLYEQSRQTHPETCRRGAF